MNWLASIPEIQQNIINTAKSLGPFLISQSDKASEAYQKHLGRIAQVDIMKQVLSHETEIYSALKKDLLKRYLNAPPMKRLQIEKDLEFVDGNIRQILIAIKSLSYGGDNFVRPNTEPKKLIEDHWIDKFNELARKRNEEWRSDLLARALAYEAATPGAVSPRALWLIGNMEEKLFNTLSELLNLCVWLSPENSPILPNSNIHALERIVDKPDRTVGALVFQLGDSGIIANTNSTREYNEKNAFIVKYDQEGYIINPKQKIVIGGVLFTPLGESIIKFFNPTWNSNGHSIFKDWIESISPEIADIMPLLTPQ